MYILRTNVRQFLLQYLINCMFLCHSANMICTLTFINLCHLNFEMSSTQQEVIFYHQGNISRLLDSRFLQCACQHIWVRVFPNDKRNQVILFSENYMTNFTFVGNAFPGNHVTGLGFPSKYKWLRPAVVCVIIHWRHNWRNITILKIWIWPSPCNFIDVINISASRPIIFSITV